jgi:peptidoglycan/LPS O-acetylase OafA/YrhL
MAANFSNSVTEFFGRASYHLFISHWVLASILIKTAGLSVLSLPLLNNESCAPRLAINGTFTEVSISDGPRCTGVNETK